MPAAQGQSVRPHTYGPPVVVEVMVKVRALAFEEAEGGYSVAVPELPGCFTQGETIEEVQAMARDAAEAWLASQHDHRRAGVIRDVTGPDVPEARP